MDEIKKYINDMLGAGKKIKPAAIYGDDDGSECVVCLYDAKDSIFSPCGHFITCKECSSTCKKCPLCATKVTCVLNRTEIVD